MTCASCEHYVAEAFSLAARSPDVKWMTAPAGVGICRRFPPRFVSDGDAGEALSVFPTVHRDQLCGEFSSGVPLS